MKKLFYFVLLSLSLLSLANAQNQCVANFTFAINQTTRTVTFTNTTTDTTLLYKWSFGDGSYSTLKNPVKIYANAGTYTACLVAYRADTTCQNTKCATIVIANPCNAGWTRALDSTNKLKMNFAALNTSADYTYNWTFGDGGTSDMRTPSHVYSKTGGFKVCLIVKKKDSTCANYVCDSIFIPDTIQCLATWGFKTDTANKLAAYFNANNTSSNYFYLWFFGDGYTSDLRTPAHTYAKAGKYKVCLGVTKKDSSCMNKICDSITISENIGCIATWTFKHDSINKLTAYFNATNTSTNFNYKWYFGDGTTSDLRTPAHTYQTSGKYKVCLSVIKKDSSCANYICDSISINVNNIIPCVETWTYTTDVATHLNATFTPTSTSTDFFYRWTFGDGGTSDLRTPSHTYKTGGRYFVCFYIVKKDSSCYKMKCDSITTGQLPCNAEWYFKPDSVNMLKINFGSVYTGTDVFVKWSFGDGTYSDAKTPSHIYTKGGKYRVCLKVTKKDSTCSIERCDSINVYESNACVANFTFVRTGKEVKFTNTSGGSYNKVKWIFGDSTSSDLTSPLHTFKKTGTYSVCLLIFKVSNTDTLCKSYKCITIIVDSVAPGCVASFTKLINHSQRKVELVNTSKGNNLVSFWTFGDDSVSMSSNPSHYYKNNGSYRICLYVINSQDTNCKSKYCEIVKIAKIDTAAPQGHPSAGFTFYAYNPSQNSLQFNPTSAGVNETYKWDFGDGETSEDASPIHSFAANDWYLVCLQITNPISSDIICESVNPDFATGLAQIQSKVSDLNYYPNPFTDKLTIELNHIGIENASVVLTDLSGRTVLTKSIQLNHGKNEITLDTKYVDGGFYVAQIQGEGINVKIKLLK